jgi:hypothetical protein
MTVLVVLFSINVLGFLTSVIYKIIIIATKDNIDISFLRILLELFISGASFYTVMVVSQRS